MEIILNILMSLIAFKEEYPALHYFIISAVGTVIGIILAMHKLSRDLK